MRIFGQLLLVDKQKVPYLLYNKTSKEFEFLHKGYATVMDIDSEQTRTLTNKMAGILCINHTG